MSLIMFRRKQIYEGKLDVSQRMKPQNNTAKHLQRKQNKTKVKVFKMQYDKENSNLESTQTLKS